MNTCPLYLKNYEKIWEKDPKAAKMHWFREAKYGLFLHYGLYSLLHQKEWALYFDKIPLNEYEKLANHFSAHNTVIKT